jgi:hypothetical protein
MNKSHVLLLQLQEVLKVDLLLCETSRIFPCTHHTKYYASQTYHTCVQLLGVLEVLLHTHASIVVAFPQSSLISNSTLKWSCAPRTTTMLPPYLWLSCLSHGNASIHLIDAILWANVLLRIAIVIKFNFGK